jgi:hypothetical protein
MDLSGSSGVENASSGGHTTPGNVILMSHRPGPAAGAHLFTALLESTWIICYEAQNAFLCEIQWVGLHFRGVPAFHSSTHELGFFENKKPYFANRIHFKSFQNASLPPTALTTSYPRVNSYSSLPPTRSRFPLRVTVTLYCSFRIDGWWARLLTMFKSSLRNRYCSPCERSGRMA